MTGSNTNELSPGEDSRRLLGSQVATEAAGNLLWRGAKSVAGELWDLAQVPGRVWSGDLSPYPSGPGPGQHALDVPQYATNLALTGMGVGNLLGGAGEGAARQFGAWHGTGARSFSEFSDEFIGSGEGAQAYGYGHYVAGARKTGELYRSQIAGRDLVPVDEEGFPLTDVQKLEKYFEPGSIVPSWTGFDRVIRFNKEPGEGEWPRWSVDVREVKPDLSKDEAGIMGRMRGDNYDFMLGRPDLWRDVAGTRTHATFPESQNVDAVGRARGWQMGQPGGLLHINVIPEEHELLDLDLPFNSQTPEIQEKLTASNLHPDALREIADRHGIDTYGIDDNMTGRELYQQHVRSYNQSGFAWSNEGPPLVSRDLDAAGIPGLKFYDAASRYKTASLEHANNWQGSPGGFGDDIHLRDFPVETNLDNGVNRMISGLRSKAKDWDIDPGFTKAFADTQPDRYAAIVEQSERNKARFNNLADWVEQEHKAGRISLKDDRTRNYVIFDPKNLEIRTWNGRPLTPVEGDPFAVGGPR